MTKFPSGFSWPHAQDSHSHLSYAADLPEVVRHKIKVHQVEALVHDKVIVCLSKIPALHHIFEGSCME